MNQEDEMLAVNNRRLEKENKALRLSLWDQYFMAAIQSISLTAATLVVDVETAANTADRMLSLRDRRSEI